MRKLAFAAATLAVTGVATAGALLVLRPEKALRARAEPGAARASKAKDRSPRVFRTPVPSRTLDLPRPPAADGPLTFVAKAPRAVRPGETVRAELKELAGEAARADLPPEPPEQAQQLLPEPRPSVDTSGALIAWVTEPSVAWPVGMRVRATVVNCPSDQIVFKLYRIGRFAAIVHDPAGYFTVLPGGALEADLFINIDSPGLYVVAAFGGGLVPEIYTPPLRFYGPTVVSPPVGATVPGEQ